ncbi:zinc finger CCCH domain-containing protein 67-like isoform X1 [Chenopodium quinoa]|uniref:zinc finger CCCH domain-containing protein 67-like isoform X1 n=1 Tax=Chenopodium quinoa TaxID=63459 RepID=UPI000B77ADEB|nr:zinc finger CCCH domain-containing protein 67-like isoform X1 [Chenopodium quinoa]XP_021773121.1 zinc finger CCCH domain-containing protein 67-like isoform X1 [Chenopodium quinoa]
MGTCEEISSSIEIQNEIKLGISPTGTHWDEQVTEEELLAQQFEGVVLQGNEVDVKIEGGENEQDEEEEKLHLYPLRSYAADCTFYLKTGTCKFGQNCRFNHPPEKGFKVALDQEKGIEENNGTFVDPGKIDCKYFRTPGGCKYGDACRYNHSAQKVENEGPELNFLGLPVRPSEQECTFYLRTGSCGYGANCRFHHPDPIASKESEARSSLGNGVYARGSNNFSGMYVGDPLQTSGVARGIPDLANGLSSMNGLPYAGMSSYHQALPQNARWNQDQAQVNLSLSAKKTPLPHQIVNNLSKKADPTTHYEHLLQSEEFPLRPGQPDCDFFMKTGDCKYRAACRYNHPISQDSKLRLPLLSSKGLYSKSKNPELPNLNPGNPRKNGTSHQQQQMQNGQYPERPGQPECEFFMKTGNCKFKSACRYHHPRDRMSTSSPCALNESGLPLRPGSKVCRNYELQGTCKYGRNCLFHHPDNSSPAISVAPVPPVDQDHSSPNPEVATNLESPAGDNVESDWGDGWVM